MSKNWKILAAELDPPIPESEVDKIGPVLEALEAAFRPLQRQIPASTPTWTGPVQIEDAE